MPVGTRPRCVSRVPPLPSVRRACMRKKSRAPPNAVCLTESRLPLPRRNMQRTLLACQTMLVDGHVSLSFDCTDATDDHSVLRRIKICLRECGGRARLRQRGRQCHHPGSCCSYHTNSRVLSYFIRSELEFQNSKNNSSWSNLIRVALVFATGCHDCHRMLPQRHPFSWLSPESMKYKLWVGGSPGEGPR